VEGQRGLTEEVCIKHNSQRNLHSSPSVGATRVAFRGSNVWLFGCGKGVGAGGTEESCLDKKRETNFFAWRGKRKQTINRNLTRRLSGCRAKGVNRKGDSTTKRGRGMKKQK